MLVILLSKVVWQIWISNCKNLKHKITTTNNFKWKSHQLQSCRLRRDLQLWYKVCFHLILFKKSYEFIYTLYCNMVITAVSYSELAVKMSSPLVHMERRQWWGAHHHRRLMVQTSCDDGLSPSVGKTKRGDSYRSIRSCKPVVILSSPTVWLMCGRW